MEKVSGRSAPRHPTCCSFCSLFKKKEEGSEALVPSLLR